MCPTLRFIILFFILCVGFFIVFDYDVPPFVHTVDVSFVSEPWVNTNSDTRDLTRIDIQVSDFTLPFAYADFSISESSWINTNSSTSAISQLDIVTTDLTTITIHPHGSCIAVDCNNDWGEHIGDKSGNLAVVIINQENVLRYIILRVNGDTLTVETTFVFLDRSAPDETVTETFSPSTSGPKAPSPPQSLESFYIESQAIIALSWKEPATKDSPIDKYEIWRDDGVSRSQYLGSTDGNTLQFIDQNNLTSGVFYTYLVYAVNDDGKSNPSNPTLILITVPLEPHPPELSASASKSQIELTWNILEDPKIPPVTQYVIERKNQTEPYTEYAKTTESSYIDEGLESATSYSYRVYAINNVGSSEYSNEVTVTTTSDLIMSCKESDGHFFVTIDGWIENYKRGEKLSISNYTRGIDPNTNTGKFNNASIDLGEVSSFPITEFPVYAMYNGEKIGSAQCVGILESPTCEQGTKLVNGICQELTCEQGTKLVNGICQELEPSAKTDDTIILIIMVIIAVGATIAALTLAGKIPGIGNNSTKSIPKSVKDDPSNLIRIDIEIRTGLEE